MKTGIVLIPFVDSTSGEAYQINDKLTTTKKRFEELLKACLISDGKKVELEEPIDNTEDTEEVENQPNEEPVDNIDEEEKTE